MKLQVGHWTHRSFPLPVGASDRAKHDKMGSYNSLYRMPQGDVVMSKGQEAETS